MKQLYFKNVGFWCNGFWNVSPREAYHEVININAIIVDVRENSLTGYKQFDVPKIIYLPNSEIKERYKELPIDKPLIIADSVGLRSKEAILFLTKLGFSNIANLAGGIVDWEQDGFPLIINKNEQLDGSCMCQLRPRLKK